MGRHRSETILLAAAKRDHLPLPLQALHHEVGDHFQVASGMKQAQTKSHVPFRITSFQNGDDLVFFPDSNEYFFFYSGMATPDRCVVQETYTYPITQLPFYKKPGK